MKGKKKLKNHGRNFYLIYLAILFELCESTKKKKNAKKKSKFSCPIYHLTSKEKLNIIKMALKCINFLSSSFFRKKK